MSTLGHGAITGLVHRTAGRLVSSALVIPRLHQANAGLREELDRMHRVFAHATIGILMADERGRITEVNQLLCRATAYTKAELLRMNLRDLIHPEDRESHAERVRALLSGATPDYVAETRLTRKDGGVVWVRVSVSPSMDGGKCCGLVALCEDLTARKLAEDQLAYQALNDPLTGLPNRRLFTDRLNQAIADARRSAECLAVLYLNLDGFSTVNEALGHATGDHLLVEVARRLRGCVRGSDTLARMGGDEFTVIAARVQESADAEGIAGKLIESLALPFQVDGQEIVLTSSIGISLYPRHSSDPDELVQQADIARYAARRDGHNRIGCFTPELGRDVRDRLDLERKLRNAVARREIVVHYQPEFDLGTGRLLRFEALARWRHPTLGLLQPSRFIPLAEETGAIVPVGLDVLEQACRQAVLWQIPGRHPVQVAVNVSSIQFFRDDFAARVTEILQRTGLSPNLLQLELTESVVLAGFAEPAKKMKQLRDLGVTFAVDDFDTGYSSLSYLPQLPFQAMKIDRTFVRGLREKSDSRAIIQSLVALAHNLKLDVIVEGVETPEELSAVRMLGCDAVQGYLLGRPCASTEKHLMGDRRMVLASEALTYS